MNATAMHKSVQVATNRTYGKIKVLVYAIRGMVLCTQ